MALVLAMGSVRVAGGDGTAYKSCHSRPSPAKASKEEEDLMTAYRYCPAVGLWSPCVV